MSGLKAATKVQSVSAHYTLSRDEIADFKNRGMEAAESAGVTIDVTEEKSE